MKSRAAIVLLVVGVALIVSDLAAAALAPEAAPLRLGALAFPVLGRAALGISLVILTLIYAAPPCRGLSIFGAGRAHL